MQRAKSVYGGLSLSMQIVLMACTQLSPRPLGSLHQSNSSTSQGLQQSMQVEEFGASGSTAAVACSGTQGSPVLKCPNGTADFKAGQGIMITGGGDLPVVQPVKQTVTASSSAVGKGTHTFCYKIVMSDSMRGMTAPSPAACVRNVPVPSYAARIWFSNVPTLNADSPNLMFYASQDGGDYQLIGIGGQSDWGIITDQGQRWGDLGGWPSSFSASSPTGPSKNEDLFTTVQSIRGTQITLATGLLHSTMGTVLVAHDDSAAIQAAINSAGISGGGVITFQPKTYNVQRPSYVLYDQNGTRSFSTNIRQSPWWEGNNYLYIAYNNISLKGAGQRLTHLVFGPQQNDNSGNVFGLGHLGVNPTGDQTNYQITETPKGSFKVALANPSDAANFRVGDDVKLYSGTFGYHITQPTTNGNTLDHYSERNTVSGITANGIITLQYPTSKRYYKDRFGDAFGIINLRGIPVHNFTVSNLWATSYNSFFRGQSVYNILIDSLYVDGHPINTFGGGGKRGMIIQNSTWSFGNGIAGWTGIDEFDQFVDVQFLNNKIYGISAAGSEKNFLSAQIYMTEGSCQFSFINNDFYNMEIGSQVTSDGVIKDNRFHNSFLNFGDAYQNGANDGYLSFNSQESLTVQNNEFTIDNNFIPPWVVGIGHFDNAQIIGNSINYTGAGGISVMQAYSGILSGNSINAASSPNTNGISMRPDPAPGASMPNLVSENNSVTATGPGSWPIQIMDPPLPYSGNLCLQGNSLNNSTSGGILGMNPKNINLTCVGNLEPHF